MFERNRYFFLFVFHSFPAALALPLALRWPRRPLLVATAQLIVCGAFKPYACLGDAGAWLGVLPLLQQQLGMLRAGPGLAYAALLLAVLGPSMWHMWIIADSANSNFFYSITLLVGVWHALLLVQLLRLSAVADRRLRTSTAAVAWGRAAKSE
jgi:phosphatidylinositol glycan class U